MNVTDKDLYWLAGLLEGEGSFLKGPPSKPNSPLISVEMKDEDIVARVSKLFGRAYHKLSSKKEGWSDTYRVQITGTRAMSLMRLLSPHMGSRRQEQISKALESYNPNLKEEVYNSRVKLTEEILNQARISIQSGKTIRSIARELDVHHETLRRKL